MTMRLPTLQKTEDSVTTRYTCLWPRCTYSSTTLPLLEKHYSEHTSQAHGRGSPKDRNPRHSVPANHYGHLEKDSRANYPLPSPDRRKPLGPSTDLARPQTLMKEATLTASPTPGLASSTASILSEAKEPFRRESLTLQSPVGIVSNKHQSGQSDNTNTLAANLYFDRTLQQKRRSDREAPHVKQHSDISFREPVYACQSENYSKKGALNRTLQWKSFLSASHIQPVKYIPFPCVRVARVFFFLQLTIAMLFILLEYAYSSIFVAFYTFKFLFRRVIFRSKAHLYSDILIL